MTGGVYLVVDQKDRPTRERRLVPVRTVWDRLEGLPLGCKARRAVRRSLRFIQHVIRRVASSSSSTLTMSGPARNEQTDPDFDFWDFVSCAVCHISYSPADRGPPPVPFWITECGHVLCNSHLSQSLLFTQTSSTDTVDKTQIRVARNVVNRAYNLSPSSAMYAPPFILPIPHTQDLRGGSAHVRLVSPLTSRTRWHRQCCQSTSYTTLTSQRVMSPPSNAVSARVACCSRAILSKSVLAAFCHLRSTTKRTKVPEKVGTLSH